MSVTNEEQAMKNAMATTHDYMLQAIRDIDKIFGEGYAKANPNLVAAYLQSCNADYAATLQYIGRKKF